uniref:NADH dehydrogenase [ubiquinone] 1 alpha subcomplex subunit 12 n=1 Tax=Saimiri boliviensis boliviensis TaxID=39432 RepID=A0A2K6SH50_SAIBB
MVLVEVLKRGLQQVSGHGGLRGYPRMLFRVNDVKIGTLVGEDKYGNKCCEDKNTVPPEWHRWLHSMTDDPPTVKPLTPHKFIWTTHKFNVTGTPDQYVSYSTARKKIQEWIPPSAPYK